MPSFSEGRSIEWSSAEAEDFQEKRNPGRMDEAERAHHAVPIVQRLVMETAVLCPSYGLALGEFISRNLLKRKLPLWFCLLVVPGRG